MGALHAKNKDDYVLDPGGRRRAGKHQEAPEEGKQTYLAILHGRQSGDDQMNSASLAVEGAEGDAQVTGETTSWHPVTGDDKEGDKSYTLHSSPNDFDIHQAVSEVQADES